jgi:hypothetical protein
MQRQAEIVSTVVFFMQVPSRAGTAVQRVAIVLQSAAGCAIGSNDDMFDPDYSIWLDTNGMQLPPPSD